MSLKDLEKRVGECDRCGKKKQELFFPTCKQVDGFFGDKEYLFVCSQPHESEFDPFTKRLDKRFYDNLARYGFGKAHITDVVKCRDERYKKLEPWQVGNCKAWLLEEIQIVKPKAIVARALLEWAKIEICLIRGGLFWACSNCSGMMYSALNVL